MYNLEPLISVIVPIYNAEAYLDNCIQSILAQSWPQIEVILVDDGSEDGSEQIIQRYLKQNPTITAFFQKNQGVSEARNAGLRAAKGEYIAFCDSDDTMAPDMLSVLLEKMRKTKTGLSCCGFAQFQDGQAAQLWADGTHCVLEGEDCYRAVLQAAGGYVWNKLFKRSLIEQKPALRFRQEFAILEDAVFVLEYLERCQSMCLTDAPLYGYRSNPGGALNSPFSLRTLTAVPAREEILRIVEKNVSSQDVCAQAWNELMRAYAINYKKLIHTPLPENRSWRERIKRGFRKGKGQYPLGSSWSLKEKLYYLFLWIAAR